MISVVIPTLNSQAGLPATLEALVASAMSGLVREVIIADGGSEDATARIADAMGAHFISAPPGRGGQMAAGAKVARGDWLLFLHADTQLDAVWEREAAAFIARAGAGGQAAVFRFALDDDHVWARALEGLVRVRCRLFALPYGDQGLLISRALYNHLGGFHDLPLMEDVDMVRRLGRRRLTFLRARAVTSAARYRQGGYIVRPLRNLTILLLYAVGVPPRLLVRLYG